MDDYGEYDNYQHYKAGWEAGFFVGAVLGGAVAVLFLWVFGWL